jgi:alpha-tubulin suppressor-like RCC1 family protein
MLRRAAPLGLLGVSLSACTPRPTANLSQVGPQAPQVATPETTSEGHEEASKSRWVDISVESEFGCAVERTGSVFCWGRGPSAEMELRELPEQPPADPTIYGTRKWGPASRIELVHNARRVSTAASRACAIVEDGRIRCWGAVRWGSQHVYDVAGITKAIDLEIGDGESCAVLEGGELWCWGAEDYGVPRLRLDNAAALSVGDNLACGLTTAGDVLCWGQAISDWYRYDLQFKQQQQSPSPGPVNPPPQPEEDDFPDLLEVGRFRGAVDLALAGWNNLCVLRGDGKVACSSQDLFTLLRDQELNMREIPEATGLAELAATRTHTCARTLDGRASCWGRNVYGQLGDGGSISREAAAPVVELTGVLDMAVAEDFSCALTRDDHIACWGFDRGEALGREERHQHTLEGLTASSLAAFGRTTCAVDASDELRCWGSDMLEQAGIAAIAKPSAISLPTKGEVLALSSGWEGCILLSGGSLSCGNWSAQGSLKFSPTMALSDVSAFSAGSPPLCAIVGKGRKATLRCGRSFNQLENDPKLKAPSALSTSNMRGCVVHGGGRVSCFAELYYWNDQPEPPREFVAIEGIRDATTLASSNYHDCALRKSGKVSCWVARTETEWSQDGRTPTANHYRPSETKDLGLTKVTQLVAGAQHHCALMANSAVRCWGDNPYSETTEWKALPELPDDIVELATGSEHTCARTKGGEVTCWGDDVWGQLGRVPTRVYLKPSVMKID